MRTFGSDKYGGDKKAYVEMVARVEDIKAAPATGQKRLIVRDKTKVHSHAAIDIDTRVAKDLEENETYVFKVSEKDVSRGTQQRARSSGFKSYDCHEKPEHDEGDWTRTFSRFGGGGRNKESKRIRF